MNGIGAMRAQVALWWNDMVVCEGNVIVGSFGCVKIFVIMSQPNLGFKVAICLVAACG